MELVVNKLKVSKIVKSSSLQFIFFKYLTYGVQFVSALLIAKYLGLFYFGIYGFVNLILQYLTYTNLGINYSLNVILSTERGIESEKSELLLSTSIWILLAVCSLIFLLGVGAEVLGLTNYFSKYYLSSYFVFVILIVFLQHFNSLFITVFRVKNRLNLINFNYFILPASQLICVFWLRGQKLFWGLVLSLLLANFISLVLFFRYSPVKITLRHKLKKEQIKVLLKRGIYLLVYNVSFYFIIIMARSVVGYFYKVEEFALFNFANNLTQAIMMLLGALGFLYYPKMLNKFSGYGNSSEVIELIEKIRKVYVTITFLIVFSSLIFVKLIILLLPNYAGAYPSFEYLLFAQLIISTNLGYSTLLIQRGKESQLTIFGFIAVGVVFLFGMIFSKYLHLPLEYVSLSALIGMAVYNLLVFVAGNKLTRQFGSFTELLKYIFNIKYLLPILAYILMLKFISNQYFAIILSLIIYTLLNLEEIFFAFRSGISVVLNNNSLNVD